MGLQGDRVVRAPRARGERDQEYGRGGEQGAQHPGDEGCARDYPVVGLFVEAPRATTSLAVHDGLAGGRGPTGSGGRASPQEGSPSPADRKAATCKPTSPRRKGCLKALSCSSGSPSRRTFHRENRRSDRCTLNDPPTTHSRG